GLGEDVDARSAAEPVCAELHLRSRLLAGDEEHTALGAERAERHEEKRGLPDARIAADEHEARRDEPAAEHAIELRHSGRDSLRVGRVDVDEAKKRASRRLGPDLRDGRDALLDEASPA